MPPPSRVEAAIAQLADAGDLRGVICVVEKWAEAADASAPARVAQAQALIGLRQLDRAWVRLKDLVERDPPEVEAIALAAEMFILRGWPNQARKVLQRGMEFRPDEDRLQALWDRAAEGPTEPEWVDEEGADTDALVRQAEQFLAHGSLVRAQGILERVRREHPDHARVADLLWAMEGDYASREPKTLAELVAAAAPGLHTLADLGDEAEHTESADLDDLPLQIEREDDGGFPLLFRNLEPPTQALPGGAPEVTAVMSMAALEKSEPNTDVDTTTDAEGDAQGGPSDTQIAMVVHKDGGPHRPAGPAHLAQPPIDKSFDLAAFRREMGMQHAATVDTDYTAGPEDEDDSVIILTRREQATPDIADTTDASGGAPPLDLDTEAEAKASQAQGSAEDDRWAKPDSDESDDDATVPRAPKLKPSRETTKEIPDAAAPAPSAASPRPAAKAKAKAKVNPKVASKPPRIPQRPVVTASDGAQVFSWPWWIAALAALLAMGVITFGVIVLIAALQ